MNKYLLLTASILSFFLIASVSASSGWVTYSDPTVPITTIPASTGGSSYVNNTYTNITNIYQNVTQVNNITVDVSNQTIMDVSGWFHNLTSHIIHVTDAMDKICIGSFCVNNPFYKVTIEGGLNVTGSSVFDNVAMFNAMSGDATFYNNVTINGYISGQPLDGSLGSGIIWANGTNNFAEVNISCSGLTCSYNNFKVRLVNTSNVVRYCNVPAGSVTATQNTHNVFYVDNNCAVQATSIQTFIETPLSPGGIADFGNVIIQNTEPYNVNGIGLENKRIIKLRKILLQSTGKHLSIVDGGFTIQTNTFPQFNITAGQYVYLMDIVATSKQVTGINKLEIIYHNSSTTYAESDQLGINLTTCDTGSGITACSNKYRRAFIFMVGYNETTDESQLHQLLPLNSVTYDTIAQCMDVVTNPLTYTLPTYYQYGAVPLYAYCGKPGDSSWTATSFIDLRNVAGGGGGGAGGDTSNLVPYNGATQNLNMSGKNITNLGGISFQNSTNDNVWRTYIDSTGALITEAI